MGYSIKDVLHNKAKALIHLETEPGLGCTEPASVGLCAATAASACDRAPIEAVTVTVDRNIYKNAMGVIIPNSGGGCGIPLAAAMGAAAGDPAKGLQVFASVDEPGLARAKALLQAGKVKAGIAQDARGLYVKVAITTTGSTVEALVQGAHDNVVSLTRDGSALPLPGAASAAGGENGDLERLKQWLQAQSLEDLLDIVAGLDSSDYAYIRDGLALNSALVEFGLSHGPGIGVGRSMSALIRQGLLKKDISRWAALRAAAGIDARMGGVPLPALTLAGSGNQGIAAGMPVLAAAEFAQIEDERVVLRAVTLSYLVTCYVKASAGLLSALCGSGIAGGAGVAAGIGYLFDASPEQIGHAINSHLGSAVAVVCDGAKTGCALKVGSLIGSAVDCALLAMRGCAIRSTDGIVCPDSAATMRALGSISSPGLSGMDPVILDIMLGKSGS